MLGKEADRGRHGEGAPRVEELPEGHPSNMRTHRHAYVEEPDEEDNVHFNREEREGYRADDYRHRQHHPQQQQQQYQPDPAAAAAAQQQQDYQNAYYRQQQQQQYNAAHQQQAAVDPFAGAFAPFGGMGAPMGFPFGGGLVGGLPGFSGMGGVGMGSFDSMFGNMFAQMDNMMRQMDGMMTATSAAAARGALPQGTTFVGHAQTFRSDGTRTTRTASSTRAAGGVHETQTFVDDGSGQRCTIARGIGDRERVVTRQRDASGQLQTDYRLRGVQDGHTFDDEWRRAAEQRLPLGGGLVGGGPGQQQQQRLALPAAQQQQQWGGRQGQGYSAAQQQWGGQQGQGQQRQAGGQQRQWGQ